MSPVRLMCLWGDARVSPMIAMCGLLLTRRVGDEKTIYISATGGDSYYAQNPIPVGGSIVKCVTA